MTGYREGVPEAKSPCSTPPTEAVAWCAYITTPKAPGAPPHPKKRKFAAAIVWHKYFKNARDLLATKLGVCPSHLNVKPIKGAS